MKNTITIMMLIFTLVITAQEKSKSKKVNFEVSGVCGMCKSRIEKAAFKTKGVKSAEWSVETKQLNLIINEYKTDPLTVKKSLAAVGHDTEEIQATESSYETLHGCCRYEREFLVKNKTIKETCCSSKKNESTSCSK